MILVYLLIALTFSAFLTALFSAHIPERRKGEVFIGFFAALAVLAWAADGWLIPALANGLKESWTPVLMLVMFGALLILSTLFSIRGLRPVRQAVPDHGNRLDAEAAAFDLVIWIAVVLAGIYLMRVAGG